MHYHFDCGCQIPIIDKTIKKFDGLPHMRIDFDNINYNCPATWNLLSSGRTQGVFQLEKDLGKTWSKKVAPHSIEDLSALISLIRPGCLRAMVEGKSMTEHYVDRKHGREEVIYIHPALETILNTTFGVLTYQEQSMQIASAIAGFDLKQADILRKAIGKKKPEIMAKVKTEFIEGCRQCGIVTDEQADEIFGWIEKSNRYAFNKSHGVGYGTMGYWSAYVKAHFPLHFYCSWLYYAREKQKPQEEIRDLIYDAKLFNVDIYPPSILKLIESAGNFAIFDKKIYFGIVNIKDIGNSQVNKLIYQIKRLEAKLKKQVDQWDWWEILTQLSPVAGKKAMNGLISAGALSHLGLSRRQMLFEYNIVSKLTNRELSWLQNNFRRFNSLSHALYALLNVDKKLGGPNDERRKIKIRDLINELINPPYSLVDNTEWLSNVETNLLGVSLTSSKVDSRNTIAADSTCLDFINGKTGDMIIAVEVVDVREYTIPKGKNQGNKMGFLTVRDSTAQIGAIAFTNVWEQYDNILIKGNTVLLYGKRSERDSFQVGKVVQI